MKVKEFFETVTGNNTAKFVNNEKGMSDHYD